MNASNLSVSLVFQLTSGYLFTYFVKVMNSIASVDLLSSRDSHSYFTLVFLFHFCLLSVIANHCSDIEPNLGLRAISCCFL